MRLLEMKNTNMTKSQYYILFLVKTYHVLPKFETARATALCGGRGGNILSHLLLPLLVSSTIVSFLTAFCSVMNKTTEEENCPRRERYNTDV